MKKWMMGAVCGGLLLAARGAEPEPSMASEAYRALWTPEIRARIDQGIEQNRKADAAWTLDGVPPGTEVTVEQTSHDFLFGANLFNFDQLGSDEANRRYKTVFGSLFNAATIPFYWKAFEPEPGKPRYRADERDTSVYWNALKEPWTVFNWRRPSPEPLIGFCETNGIVVHGHPLIWGNTQWNHPAWISKAPGDVTEMERLFEKHVREIARYYQGRIPSWDVVNESVDPFPGSARYGVMPDDYTFKVFKWADEAFPASVRFCINDSWRTVYPPFIRDLIARGARIDVVGLQMHIFTSKDMLDVMAGKRVFPNGTSWQPQDVIRDLETLDTLQRPIHLSEITIPAPGDSAADWAMQAELTREMYRLWFSWPSIYRITWWNVVDDCGAKGEPLKSGLFTRAMKPKPAYFVLNELINHDWKTRLTVRAGENGRVSFRGFRGRYRLMWKDEKGQKKETVFHLE